MNKFNRNLLVVVAILFVLSIAAFSYAVWILESENFAPWMMLLNVLIIAIPFALLYGSIYLLVIAWRAHASGRQVEPPLAKIIHWAPRLAALMIIFFASLFSLDVFEMEAAPLELLAGFLIHNIPSIGMLVLLILAWKRPAVGFAAFLVAAALFLFFFVRDIEALPSLLLFVLPIFLIAMLFYADWRWLEPPNAEADPAGRP